MYQPPYPVNQLPPPPPLQRAPLQVQTALSPPPPPATDRYLYSHMASPVGTHEPIRPSGPQSSSTAEYVDRNLPDVDYSDAPGPPAVSHIWDNKIWSLHVVQNPQRARMCGFGDKDRRPISPPPCIRLIIVDVDTQKQIDYEQVTEANLSHLVITVDIWDVHGQRELNLVKQSSGSPCISSSVTTTFPQAERTPELAGHYPTLFQANSMFAHQPPNHASQVAPGLPPAGYGFLPGNQPAAVYTRNLIGSLSGSAFALRDQHRVPGIWFVLQDLSVRTEGWFRLKLSFFNLSSTIDGPATGDSSSGSGSGSRSAPCLASAYTKPFRVYSAKKFPGVVESTELSKAFAAQGIKIPIRKDHAAEDAASTGNKRRRDNGEGDELDEDSDGNDGR